MIFCGLLSKARGFLRFNCVMASKRLASETPAADEPPNKQTKLAEDVTRQIRKVAMLLAYSGKEYIGMQINPGFKTVESVLFKGMLSAGAITQEQHDQPGEKLHFQRGARTDKGVSAAGNVCSLKLNLAINDLEDKINRCLPPDVRVLNIRRATKSFNSKNAASARTYQYLIPTFAFTPATDEVKETFRLAEETVMEINKMLQTFKGTHNFHNFTSGKKPTDASARRYIMDFYMDKPFVRDELEFALITVKGQSFMLHQIRKMVGLVVAIIRGQASFDILDKCWGPERVDIPKAPGLGLTLECLHYDFYNTKFGKDGLHQRLEWPELQPVIQNFKEEFIISEIVKTEKHEKSMQLWLPSLALHHFGGGRPDGPPGRPDATPSCQESSPVVIERESNADPLDTPVAVDIINSEKTESSELIKKQDV